MSPTYSVDINNSEQCGKIAQQCTGDAMNRMLEFASQVDPKHRDEFMACLQSSVMINLGATLFSYGLMVNETTFEELSENIFAEMKSEALRYVEEEKKESH